MRLRSSDTTWRNLRMLNQVLSLALCYCSNANHDTFISLVHSTTACYIMRVLDQSHGVYILAPPLLGCSGFRPLNQACFLGSCLLHRETLPCWTRFGSIVPLKISLQNVVGICVLTPVWGRTTYDCDGYAPRHFWPYIVYCVLKMLSGWVLYCHPIATLIHI